MDFELEGLDEVMEKLKMLENDGIRRAAMAATRKGLSETRDKAKANASRLDNPKTAASIADNIALRVSAKRFKSHGVIMGRVGVKGGAKQYADTNENVRKENAGGDTFYWRFIEFGTSKMSAKPFLRNAYDVRQAAEAFSQTFKIRIAKEIKRK